MLIFNNEKFKGDEIHQESIKLGCLSNLVYFLLCVEVNLYFIFYDISWGSTFFLSHVGLVLCCLVYAISLNYKKKTVLNGEGNNVSMKRLALEAILMVIGLIIVYIYAEKGEFKFFMLPIAFVIAYTRISAQQLNLIEEYLKKKTRKRVIFEKVMSVLAWIFFIYYAAVV